MARSALKTKKKKKQLLRIKEIWRRAFSMGWLGMFSDRWWLSLGLKTRESWRYVGKAILQRKNSGVLRAGHVYLRVREGQGARSRLSKGRVWQRESGSERGLRAWRTLVRMGGGGPRKSFEQENMGSRSDFGDIILRNISLQVTDAGVRRPIIRLLNYFS